jgi:hypothetical protein
MEAVRIYAFFLLGAIRRRASEAKELEAEGYRVMADEHRRIAADFRPLAGKALPTD